MTWQFFGVSIVFLLMVVSYVHEAFFVLTYVVGIPVLVAILYESKGNE